MFVSEEIGSQISVLVEERTLEIEQVISLEDSGIG